MSMGRQTTAPEKVAEFIELRSPAQKAEQVFARTEVHYEQGQTVAIYSRDPDELSELDQTLWSLKQNSFIPHVRAEETDELHLEPVVLFGAEADPLEADVLIIASADELPAWAVHFAHLYDFAEVYDEDRRTAGRGRFAACKAAGYRMRFIQPQG
jgi:DNA polymerase-3 subunit chi